ncbi:hypothetical protein [Paenibacillus maysiensis]|uniref:hypothetical protein n=1 Tax=Paenibacillus maysiensis TaxID=1155954 RepID=UPI0012DE3D52|nr:hypothetical protein [Paenibacillus maysiensis]
MGECYDDCYLPDLITANRCQSKLMLAAQHSSIKANTVLRHRALAHGALSPGYLSGERFTAIGRSYRRAALTFPHPMGWGKFFLAAARCSGG